MKRILIAFVCWLAAHAGAGTYVIAAPPYDSIHNYSACPVGDCTNFTSSMSVQGRFELSEPLAPNLNPANVAARYTISDGVTVYSSDDPQMMPGIFFVWTDAKANLVGVSLALTRWQRPGTHGATDRFDLLMVDGFSAGAVHNLPCTEFAPLSKGCMGYSPNNPGVSQADLFHGPKIVEIIKLMPVFRFYNAGTRAHFFTASVAERDHVLATYPVFAYEGTAFHSQGRPQNGAVPVYRFYNTASGTHFYTVSEAERAEVIKNYPTYLYEGPVWYAYTKPLAGTTAVYRFYRTDINSHFYTANKEEMEYVRATYPAFKYEGIGYYTWTGP